mmetsp:Transcript_36127/g.116327  ORF Transcript_36127/g.116327 Transcript_36127/m.116327 type:complete len:392 (+) Transcript_36127:427-1602(+)
MEEEIGGAAQEMWTKGGGRAGYEEIGRNDIARDPVLRLYLRSDEAEGAIRSAPQERPRGQKRDCHGRERVLDHARAGNERDVEGDGPGVPPAQVAPLHSCGSDGRLAKEDSRRKPAHEGGRNRNDPPASPMPNSMADAAAKAHLRSRVTSAYEMDLARHVTNRACIYMHEEEGQAPEIRDRRLYQEAKEKIGRWVRKRLDGGHAARKGGDDNVWRTVIKATGTISGDAKYEGGRERGPNSTQRQPEALANGTSGRGTELLEAGRGRTTRAMGTTLKTTHCELEGEGRRRKRGDRSDDAASAGGKRRQRGDEDDEQRGEQTASGAGESDHVGETDGTRGRKSGPPGRGGRRQDTSPAQRLEAQEDKKNKTRSMETREGARRSADKQQRRRRK